MNVKLVFKLMVLLFALVMVVFIREYAITTKFKEGITAFFGTNKAKNTIVWCVDKVVDVAWVSDEVPDKLKLIPMSDLRSDYCELQTEPITDVDLDKLQWKSLAESHGPTGQKSLLEWNSEFQVFRTGGMPFKSSKFSAELKP